MKSQLLKVKTVDPIIPPIIHSLTVGENQKYYLTLQYSPSSWSVRVMKTQLGSKILKLLGC